MDEAPAAPRELPDVQRLLHAPAARGLPAGARRSRASSSAPCDARLSVHRQPSRRTGGSRQVKGSRLLDRGAPRLGRGRARPSAAGVHATLYLSPAMYHRVHSPVDGRVVAWRYVPGRLFPVNAAGVRSVPGLFTRNERVAVFLRHRGPRPRRGRPRRRRQRGAHEPRLRRPRHEPRGAPAGAEPSRRSPSPSRAGTSSAPSTSARPWCCSSPTRRSLPRRPRATSSAWARPLWRAADGRRRLRHARPRPARRRSRRSPGSDVILHAGDIGGTPRARRSSASSRRSSPCAATWTAAGRGSCRSGASSTSAASPVLILHDRALVGPDPFEGEAEGGPSRRRRRARAPCRPRGRATASSSSATRTSRWPRSGRACCGSTPGAPGRAGSSCRCRWAGS